MIEQAKAAAPYYQFSDQKLVRQIATDLFGLKINYVKAFIIIGARRTRVC